MPGDYTGVRETERVLPRSLRFLNSFQVGCKRQCTGVIFRGCQEPTNRG